MGAAVRELWRRTVGKIAVSPVAALDGVVVVVASDDRQVVSALEQDTGALRWRTNDGNLLTSKASFGHGLMVAPHAGGGGDGMVALDVRTGRERWKQRVSATFLDCTGLGDGLVGWGSHQDFGCVSLENGRPVFRAEHAKMAGWQPWVATSSVVVDGVLEVAVDYVDRYVDDRQPPPNRIHRTTAVDIATGEIAWVRDGWRLAPGLFWSQTGVEAVHMADGSRRWSAEVSLAAWTVLTAGGNLVVRAADGIAAFDAATGAPAWFVEAPAKGSSLIAAGPAHVLLRTVSGYESEVRLLDARTGDEMFAVAVRAHSRVAGDGRLVFASFDRRGARQPEPPYFIAHEHTDVAAFGEVG